MRTTKPYFCHCLNPIDQVYIILDLIYYVSKRTERKKTYNGNRYMNLLMLIVNEAMRILNSVIIFLQSHPSIIDRLCRYIIDTLLYLVIILVHNYDLVVY